MMSCLYFLFILLYQYSRFILHKTRKAYVSHTPIRYIDDDDNNNFINSNMFKNVYRMLWMVVYSLHNKTRYLKNRNVYHYTNRYHYYMKSQCESNVYFREFKICVLSGPDFFFKTCIHRINRIICSITCYIYLNILFIDIYTLLRLTIFISKST